VKIIRIVRGQFTAQLLKRRILATLQSAHIKTRCIMAVGLSALLRAVVDCRFTLCLLPAPRSFGSIVGVARLDLPSRMGWGYPGDLMSAVHTRCLDLLVPPARPRRRVWPRRPEASPGPLRSRDIFRAYGDAFALHSALGADCGYQAIETCRTAAWAATWRSANSVGPRSCGTLVCNRHCPKFQNPCPGPSGSTRVS